MIPTVIIRSSLKTSEDINVYYTVIKVCFAGSRAVHITNSIYIDMFKIGIKSNKILQYMVKVKQSHYRP
jgi:hypothetical protein